MQLSGPIGRRARRQAGDAGMVSEGDLKNMVGTVERIDPDGQVRPPGPGGR